MRMNWIAAAAVALLGANYSPAQELIPPISQIKADHPRVFLRPNATPHAVSLEQLRGIERDGDFAKMLAQLKKQDNAAAQAMVWLLTKDEAAAQKAIARMQAYHFPGKVDTFHVYFRLMEMGLAYDWLYSCPQFTNEIKAQVRANVLPLAKEGLKNVNDHMFHNYVWMSAGGVALWGMVTAGEDEACSAVFEQIRKRYNDGLYPAWRYLDGLPSEPMGYWSQYVFSSGVFTLLATQSAFEVDAVSAIRSEKGSERKDEGGRMKDEQGARHASWIDRHFENLIHSTLPDMRYIPWGDLQSGPNGGVTMEMAGIIDSAAWLLKSGQGKQFSDWLAAKRGLGRFYGDTPIFYMLYTRQLGARCEKPGWPGLSFLAGGKQSGHFIARSAWSDDATVVAFTCTDHLGDHHHYDQGSFIIYRRGLLAVDPPVYKHVRGPQQKTEYHNTLLIGGQAQRPARGQWFVTIEDFKKNLGGGKRLETGDICGWKEAGAWAAVSGQFAQAYDCPELQSCLRQLLFLRPDTVVVVDRLEAAPGKQVPEVKWLLQLPAKPETEGGALVATNGKSWIRCRAVLPAKAPEPAVEATPVGTQRASYTYGAGASIMLVHVIDVGGGAKAGPAVAVKAAEKSGAVEVTVGEKVFMFAPGPEGAVSAGTR